MFTIQIPSVYILLPYLYNFYLHEMNLTVYTVCNMIVFTPGILQICVSYACLLSKENPPIISRNGRFYCIFLRLVSCSLWTLTQ